MEITEKDKAIIDTLVNPSDPIQSQYQHDFTISQKILGMLIMDRHFLVQSMDLVKPEYFEDESHHLICSIVFDFFKQYKTLASKIVIQNEIREKRGKSEHLYQYLGELEAIINDYVPGVDSRDYLMDKIVYFAKEQAARCAVVRTMDILKRKPVGAFCKIWDVWRESLSVDKGHELGLDYFKTLEERYAKMDEMKGKRDEIFSSGFPDHGVGSNRRGLDSMITAGGLCRKEVGAYVGGSGSGKSLNLIGAGAQNLVWGKKVCYITLEMGEEKIAKRFDSWLSEENYRSLADNKKMVIDAIRSHVRHEEDQRRLVIKHYPGGTADINTFRAYLSQLNLYGFKPDLLVVDYVGELKDLPGVKTYESRQLLVREMTTLAQEENMCILTAIQANRQGREIQDFDGSQDIESLADSYGSARPLSYIWTINKFEQSSNLGHIFFAKNRDGISKRCIWYELDSGTLKMKEITKEDYTEKLAMFRSKKSGNVDNVLKVKKV